MALFGKSEVIVLKEADSFDAQISELKELETKASGGLQKEIQNQIRILEKGAQGEDEIMFQLNYAGMDMVVLRDLYIVCDDLSAQIDYYVVTPKVHFIIESKNLYGNITINNNGDFIRTYTWRGKTIKEGIESPITQNDRHMLVLKRRRMQAKGVLTKAIIKSGFEDLTKPLVVLANSKTVLNDRYAPKAIKGKVIRADNLANKIWEYNKASKEIASGLKRMKSEAEAVLSYHTDNRTDYVARFRDAVEEQLKEQPKTEPSGEAERTCPRCKEGKLVERNGKRGAFLGCSRFPKCRYTEDIVKEGE